MLIVDDHERDGWRVISASGELEVAGAPQLRSAIVGAIAEGATDLLLDLGRVEFIDSFGLGVVVGALKRVRGVDGRLVVVVAEPRVREVFRLTGLDTVFDLVDSLDMALAR